MSRNSFLNTKLEIDHSLVNYSEVSDTLMTTCQKPVKHPQKIVKTATIFGTKNTNVKSISYFLSSFSMLHIISIRVSFKFYQFHFVIRRNYQGLSYDSYKKTVYRDLQWLRDWYIAAYFLSIVHQIASSSLYPPVFAKIIRTKSEGGYCIITPLIKTCPESFFCKNSQKIVICPGVQNWHPLLYCFKGSPKTIAAE